MIIMLTKRAMGNDATLVGNRRWCFLNVHCTFQLKWQIDGLWVHHKVFSLPLITAIHGVQHCMQCMVWSVSYCGGTDTYYMGHVVEVSYTLYNKL